MINNVRASAIVFLSLCAPLLQADKLNKVVATINVGQNPTGLAITPDSLFAYVANENDNGVSGGNTVSVIDLTTNAVVQTLTDSSFNGPFTVTMNSAGTKAYVTNTGSTTVSIIDIGTNTVSGVINGFNGPSGLVISSNGHYAYVNNYGIGSNSGTGTTVSVVDLNTNTIVGPPLNVGLAPAAVAITPDGQYVYVVNYVDGNPGTGTMSIIRTSDNSVQANAISGFSGPFAIAITPNGEYAYVTNFGSNNFSPVGQTVSVVSLSQNEIVATVNLGIQPAGLAIAPDGSYVYVSNYSTLYDGPNFTDLTASQGTVNIIRVGSNQIVSPVIDVGFSPGSITVSPNGLFGYVCNFSSNTVSVIQLLGTYDFNRLKPIYNSQVNETTTKLRQAGLL